MNTQIRFHDGIETVEHTSKDMWNRFHDGSVTSMVQCPFCASMNAEANVFYFECHTCHNVLELKRCTACGTASDPDILVNGECPECAAVEIE